MKDLIVKKTGVVKLELGLTQPFRTSLGEHKILENVLFSLELENGVRGWGEAAVAPHITGETLEGTITNLNNAAEELKGKDISDYLGLSAECTAKFSKNKCALAAVEMAVMDSLSRSWGIPLWKFFGRGCKKITSDVTIVISSEADASRNAAQFYKQGFRAFKIKIGNDFDEDIKRVRVVRKVTRKSNLYLDANQGYSCKEALDFLKHLKKYGITPKLFEQPLRKDDLDGMIKLTRSADVPICADESAASLKDAVTVIKRKACRVINIKTMKTGFIASREIAMLANRSGIDLMIGGMMESSLAMTASAHMAAGMGCFKFVDLDTPFFIKREQERNPYLTRRGVYDLSKVKMGIGITPAGGRIDK